MKKPLLKMILKLFILLVLLFPNNVVGETEIKITWEVNSENSCITGYKIVMDNASNVILTIKGKEKRSVKYIIINDKVPHTFSIYSYYDYSDENDESKIIKSELGDFVVLCWKPVYSIIKMNE